MYIGALNSYWVLVQVRIYSASGCKRVFHGVIAVSMCVCEWCIWWGNNDELNSRKSCFFRKSFDFFYYHLTSMVVLAPLVTSLEYYGTVCFTVFCVVTRRKRIRISCIVNVRRIVLDLYYVNMVLTSPSKDCHVNWRAWIITILCIVHNIALHTTNLFDRYMTVVGDCNQIHFLNVCRVQFNDAYLSIISP